MQYLTGCCETHSFAQGFYLRQLHFLLETTVVLDLLDVRAPRARVYVHLAARSVFGQKL